MDPARATEVLSQRERRTGWGRERRQESTPVIALLWYSAFWKLAHELLETHRFNERRKIRSFPSSDEGASRMVKLNRFCCCGGRNRKANLRAGKGCRGGI